MKQINQIILKEIKSHLGKFGLILFLIFLTVGFEAFSPWPFKILLDNVLGGESLDTTTYLGRFLSNFTTREAIGFFVILAYCLVSIFANVTEYLSSIITKKLNAGIVNSFSRQAFDNLATMAPGYYRQQEIGDYIYRLSYDISAVGSLLENGLLPVVTNVLFLITTGIILLLINKSLAFIALGILPLLALTLWICNRQMSVVSERSENSNSKLFSFIQEVLSQLKIIQAFNRQKDRSQAFGHNQENALTEELNVTGLNLLLNLMIGVVAAVGYAVVIIYGIHSVFIGAISTGLLIVFIFYLDDLTTPVLAIMAALSSIQEDYVKVVRLNDFFTKKFQAPDNGTITDLKEVDIIFDHVTVRGSEDSIILDDVSCVIPGGKKTVIVGVSGSGKTTMMNLLLRFIEPTSGRIALGETSIEDFTLAGLRAAIAYAPQEINLFNDSIKNNIIFGSKASVTDMKKAADLAVADKFIKRLPGGFSFRVGESGSSLSGGQRQRLMLARAFLKRAAKILIFDEPISALDVKTRKNVMENIDNISKGKTTIIVSNIMEIINKADYIIVMNEGKILHAGSSKNIMDESRLTRLILESN